MNHHLIPLACLCTGLMLTGCTQPPDYDASGYFEADEVIVSAQQNGLLLSFPVQEGDSLRAGQQTGQIDVTLPTLQKEQTEASRAALRKKTASAGEQVALVRQQLTVQQSQLDQLIREKQRTANLVKADAVPQKQLDDLTAAIEQLQKQMNTSQQQIKLYQDNAATQNRGVLSEEAPLELLARQFQEQINRGQVINPTDGVVLTKYALQGELATLGKPLYKVANMDTLYLKAYFTGDYLSRIKTGQPVTVRIDDGRDAYKTYPGTLTWIASKSEFTPKTIQTKSERANLVYAVKVRVQNDGFLKIGMYGEVLLPDSSHP